MILGIHVDTNGLEFKEDEDIEVELENEIRQMSQMTEDEFKRKVNEQLKSKANEKGSLKSGKFIQTL